MPIYRSHKLPHLQPKDGTFFITTRLYGSIPQPVIAKLKQEYEIALQDIRASPVLIENQESLLPTELTKTIANIRRKKEIEAGKRYFVHMDNFLDKNLNAPHWLKQPEIAQINYDNILFYAERYFEIWAFTIMSNHIHLLLTLRSGSPPLHRVMGDMKKFASRQSNKILGRTGPFWEQEYYDHYVRVGEFGNIYQYILNNPVKAGIVQSAADYQWNYAMDM